jgi:polysaccharide pyruvyl transferase WcaK-like protein
MTTEQESPSRSHDLPGHPVFDSCGCTSESGSRGPRIVLLTPYNGGNLGDAVIQDSVIANLRLRLPDAQFSGVSLNSDNFIARHGVEGFALLETDSPFYRMAHGRVEDWREDSGEPNDKGRIRSLVTSVPLIGNVLKLIYGGVKRLRREIHHSIGAYRFLRTKDLLMVSGGGQLDEEWGGPWHHPYALFKWAVLARLVGIPYVVASVGACKAKSRTSRFFLSWALGMADYRSYRDKNSRDIAASLRASAAEDKIVPDLAFSLPSSELPPSAGIRSIAQGRPVVAIGPIAYVKPGNWPSENRALYDRYVQQMASVIATLLDRDYFILIVWSSLGDDESVIPEILGQLSPASKEKLVRQLHIPAITAWKDLVALLQDVDFLIASRLHSTILGLITQKPTIAISFDPKVDWLMQDFGQTDSLLQIRDFRSEEVLQALDRLIVHRSSVVDHIIACRQQVLATSAVQYDTLAELAAASHGQRG